MPTGPLNISTTSRIFGRAFSRGDERTGSISDYHFTDVGLTAGGRPLISRIFFEIPGVIRSFFSVMTVPVRDATMRKPERPGPITRRSGVQNSSRYILPLN